MLTRTPVAVPLESGPYSRAGFAGGLRHAQCSIRTPYGPLASQWSANNETFTLAVTIPPNTAAEMVLPAENPDTVMLDKIPVTSARGVKPVTSANGKLTFQLGSGHYEFTARPAPRPSKPQ